MSTDSLHHRVLTEMFGVEPQAGHEPEPPATVGRSLTRRVAAGLLGVHLGESASALRRRVANNAEEGRERISDSRSQTSLVDDSEPGDSESLLNRLDTTASVVPDTHSFLAAQEWFAEETMRGRQGSRFVQRGGVLLTRAASYSLALDDLSPQVRSKLASGTRLDLVKFSFRLRELPPKFIYKQVSVRIKLDTRLPVLSLQPNLEGNTLLTRQELIDASRDEMKPLVIAADYGPLGFGWTFSPREGAPLSPGDIGTTAIIESPAGSAELAGTFETEAVVSRQVLGRSASQQVVPIGPAKRFSVAF